MGQHVSPRERGASAVEYGLLAAGVGGLLIVTLTTLLHLIGGGLDCMSGTLQGSGTANCSSSDPGAPPLPEGPEGAGVPDPTSTVPTTPTISTAPPSTSTTTTTTDSPTPSTTDSQPSDTPPEPP